MILDIVLALIIFFWGIPILLSVIVILAKLFGLALHTLGEVLGTIIDGIVAGISLTLRMLAWPILAGIRAYRRAREAGIKFDRAH